MIPATASPTASAAAVAPVTTAKLTTTTADIITDAMPGIGATRQCHDHQLCHKQLTTATITTSTTPTATITTFTNPPLPQSPLSQTPTASTTYGVTAAEPVYPCKRVLAHLKMPIIAALFSGIKPNPTSQCLQLQPYQPTL